MYFNNIKQQRCLSPKGPTPGLPKRSGLCPKQAIIHSICSEKMFFFWDVSEVWSNYGKLRKLAFIEEEEEEEELKFTNELENHEGSAGMQTI